MQRQIFPRSSVYRPVGCVLSVLLLVIVVSLISVMSQHPRELGDEAARRIVTFIPPIHPPPENTTPLSPSRQNATGNSPHSRAPSIGGCQVFPSNSIWNYDISHLPVDKNSATYVNTVGASQPLRNDFGSDGTFPYVIVPKTQPFVPVHFTSPNDSNPGPYPIPTNAPIEGSEDHHVLVIQSGNCKDYELYVGSPQSDGSWKATRGAIFDLTSNTARDPNLNGPDAAGLPMTPLLVRYDEVKAGAINHAIRVVVNMARVSSVWPASPGGGGNGNGDAYPPMGERFRLKASVDIAKFSPPIRVILKALQDYGMLVADEGPDTWSISGAPDPGWDSVNLSELQQIHGSDFEAVDESSLEISHNSYQVKGSSSSNPLPTSSSPRFSLTVSLLITSFAPESSFLGVCTSTEDKNKNSNKKRESSMLFKF